MTGKQKIEAALSPQGTPQVPAVFCYEDIFVRDHWQEITTCPWWYQFEPCHEKQIQWQRDFFDKTHIDWFTLYNLYPLEELDHLHIDIRSNGAFLIDDITGYEKLLKKPIIGGGNSEGSYIRENPADSFEDIDRRIPVKKTIKASKKGLNFSGFLSSGFTDKYPNGFICTPLNDVFFLFGFIETMTKIAEHHAFIEYSCKRYLDHSIQKVREARAAGASGIFIQDCFSDMISPDDYKIYNLQYTIPLVDEIRILGMKSIYYFCGNPFGKIDHILSIATDALSLEESKKNFIINIDEICNYVNGRCTLLGNLDSIEILQNGSDNLLLHEIKRQLTAGIKNKYRFIMSLGSPVTPSTSVDRVQKYCDLVHEFGIY